LFLFDLCFIDLKYRFNFENTIEEFFAKVLKISEFGILTLPNIVLRPPGLFSTGSGIGNPSYVTDHMPPVIAFIFFI